MVEHRQVVNFFVAMDQVIRPDPPGVWLAVTSISFDISVLELLWTLTRGYHVVVAADAAQATDERPVAAAPSRPVRHSACSTSPRASPTAPTGYRPVARRRALRRRQRFRGGVDTRATLPRVRRYLSEPVGDERRVGGDHRATSAIRAGSVVLPLHSPMRVAEEWAVVDNLSSGRVGISVASGWQPNDFVLNPAGFARRQAGSTRNIDLVRRLWRGETVSIAGHHGARRRAHLAPAGAGRDPGVAHVGGQPRHVRAGGDARVRTC